MASLLIVLGSKISIKGYGVEVEVSISRIMWCMLSVINIR